jgi:hypothetical protein
VGNSVAFLRKIDALGTLIWERKFDTSGTDLADVIALTPSGNIVVAGRTSGAFPGSTNHGQIDLFVAEVSPRSDLLGLGQFGDERPQHPVAIAVQSDNAFVVAGYDDIYVIGNAVHEWRDGFFAKFVLGALGVVQNAWWRQENSSIGDEITGIASARDKSGDLFVARHHDTNPAAGGGISIDRVSSGGVPRWQKTISTLSLDYIAGVAVSPSGRLVVAGNTLMPLNGAVLGDSDGFVTELDPGTGEKLWGQQVGSSNADWISHLAIDSNENIWLTGSSVGAVKPGYASTGDDPFVLSVASRGAVLGAWQGPPGIPNDDTYAVATMGCGDTVALAGSLSGVSPPGDLGRTDAELTLVTVERFDTMLTNGFDLEP